MERQANFEPDDEVNWRCGQRSPPMQRELQRSGSGHRYELRSASRIPHVTTGESSRSSRLDGFMSVCRSAVTSMSHAVSVFSRQAGLTSSPSPSPARSQQPLDIRITSQPVSSAFGLGARPKTTTTQSDYQTTYLMDIEMRKRDSDGRRHPLDMRSPFELQSARFSTCLADDIIRRRSRDVLPLVQGPIMSSRLYPGASASSADALYTSVPQPLIMPSYAERYDPDTKVDAPRRDLSSASRGHAAPPAAAPDDEFRDPERLLRLADERTRQGGRPLPLTSASVERRTGQRRVVDNTIHS